MAPDYSLSPEIDSFIEAEDPFGFSSYSPMLREEDTTQYGFGVPAAYRSNIALLEQSQQESENKALELLQRSMKTSADVSPGQGIAAALLAAIPTIGGYMIGKSVGRPELPAGYFEAGGTRAALGDTSGIGGAAGGLAGSVVGLKSAGGYLKGLEADQAQANKSLVAQAGIYTNKAERAQARADQLTAAGLAQQAEIDQIPLREASQMRLQDNAAANSRANQLTYLREKDQYEQLPPDVLAKAQDALGIPRNPNMTTDQLKVLTNAIAENRRGYGQDLRLSGQNIMPPSPQTKQQMKDIIATKEIGDRYINQLQAIASQDPSWLSRTVDKALPQTEIGALNKALSLYAVQLRNAREAGIMTEQDFERYNSYLQIGELDTMESVILRLNELRTVTDITARSVLTAAELGRENVDTYKQYFGLGQIESPITGGSVTLSPQIGGLIDTGANSRMPQQGGAGVAQTSGGVVRQPTSQLDPLTGSGTISRPTREQFSSDSEYMKALEYYIATKKGPK